MTQVRFEMYTINTTYLIKKPISLLPFIGLNVIQISTTFLDAFLNDIMV